LRHFQKALSQIVTWLSVQSNNPNLPRFDFNKALRLLSLDQKIFLLGLFLLPFGFIWRFENITPLVFGLSLDLLTPSVHLSEILFIISFGIFLFKSTLKLNFAQTLGVSAIILVLTLEAILSPIPSIGLWRVLKLLEVAMVALYTSRSFVSIRFQKAFLWVLAISTLIQITLGLAQFTLGNSLNLRILGGHFFDLSTLGVAKITIGGQEYLRAYGTLPHPNILAGFIALSFSLVLMLISPLGRIGYLIFWIYLIGLTLTFSRQAWLAVMLGLFATINWRSLPKLRVSLPYILVLIITLATLGTFILTRTRQTLDLTSPSIVERQTLIGKSWDLFVSHPIFGAGLGQSIYVMAQTFPNLDFKLFQPVHNLFVLPFVEAGIIGGLLFLAYILGIAYLLWIKRKSQFYLKKPLIASFIIFLGIAMFDHYFLTLDQGLLLLGIYSGLWASKW